MHDRKSCGCEQRFLSSLTAKKEQGTSVSQGKLQANDLIKIAAVCPLLYLHSSNFLLNLLCDVLSIRFMDVFEFNIYEILFKT